LDAVVPPKGFDPKDGAGAEADAPHPEDDVAFAKPGVLLLLLLLLLEEDPKFPDDDKLPNPPPPTLAEEFPKPPEPPTEEFPKPPEELPKPPIDVL
jgi:hypothetical protein